MLQGLAWGLPGFAFAWWHLHEARSREGRLTPGPFWGRSLYFHLVSFIAAVTVLGAVTVGLYALIDAAYPPECPDVLVGAGFCADAAESLRACGVKKLDRRSDLAVWRVGRAAFRLGQMLLSLRATGSSAACSACSCALASTSGIWRGPCSTTS
jgi:hypothetical protein